MKKSKTYLAVSITENGKNYAYMVSVSGSDNLVSVLSRIKNLVSANICESKKSAEWVVSHWNACYKVNGTYMFSGPDCPF